MPAAAIIRGIIISISVFAALGIAVLENPQIQEWLEEQRRKIAELLRSVGEELDPESRRTAEAFAYEGRTPATDDGLRREASGAQEAAALATGRSLSDASTIRRAPMQGRISPEEAEERRRKGREYLAQRNQQMIELQQRRREAREAGLATPPTPTFDSLVNSQGMLRDGSASQGEHGAEHLTVLHPTPASTSSEISQSQRSIEQPVLAHPRANLSAFERGALLANPFDDEFAIPERSDTPRPPVPPKVELDRPEPSRQISMPGSFDLAQPQLVSEHVSTDLSESQHNALSYDEQLALALSLSEAETAKQTATNQLPLDDDADLKAAIAASLKEMNVRMAGSSQTPGAETPKAAHQSASGPLVDLTFSQPSVHKGPASVMSDTTDDLYTVSPQLTQARLATFNSMHLQAPLEPVVARPGAASPTPSGQMMESSFYSAPSSVAPPAQDYTNDREPVMEIESDSDDFQSEAEPLSRTLSPELEQVRPASALSGVEIINIEDDSDVDMVSDVGDGTMTPDSWTEVGSRDGEESEAEGRPRQSILL